MLVRPLSATTRKVSHSRTNRRLSKRKILRSVKYQQQSTTRTSKSNLIRNFLQAIRCIRHPITLAYNEKQLEDICQQMTLQMQPLINQHQTPSTSDKELCIFLCGICQHLLYEPLTLYCGHTYCEKCIKNEPDNTDRVCRRCPPDIIGQIQSSIQLGKKALYLKNIFLNELFEKSMSFQTHRSCMVLYYRGQQEYNAKNYDLAVQYYNNALDICEDDHLVLNGRSQAYLALNRFDESLSDAEHIIKLKPDWSKGYLRKSEALFEMKRYTTALLSSLMALTFDPEDPVGKTIMAKHLHAVLHESSSEDIDESLLTSELRSSNTNDPDIIHQEEHTETSNQIQNDADEPGEAICMSTTSELSTTKKMALCRNSCERCNTFNYKQLNIRDFECSICVNTFWFPITTPCGHVFCRECLIRSIDNTLAQCPMCKNSLTEFFPMLIQSHVNQTEMIHQMIEIYFPDDFIERREQYHKDGGVSVKVNDNNLNIIANMPIFVCVLALPNCVCPLHVFEPRYRLMMRRSFETESRSFGMCKYDETTGTFADCGTLLYIRGIMYTEDGRSVVDTIGQRRFRVLSRGMKDGYSTANIQLIKDQLVEQDEYNNLVQLNIDTYNKVRHWFDNLDLHRKSLVSYQLQQYPICDEFTITSVDGPQWHWIMLNIVPIEPLLQYAALESESLRIRLQMLNDAVTFLQQQQQQQQQQ